jgi:hypothetical protein
LAIEVRHITVTVALCTVTVFYCAVTWRCYTAALSSMTISTPAKMVIDKSATYKTVMGITRGRFFMPSHKRREAMDQQTRIFMKDHSTTRGISTGLFRLNHTLTVDCANIHPVCHFPQKE